MGVLLELNCTKRPFVEVTMTIVDITVISKIFMGELCKASYVQSLPRSFIPPCYIFRLALAGQQVIIPVCARSAQK